MPTTLNQILDIAIVLVGVYATLSCVCSWINEKIAAWLRLRGWNLFKGVLALVDTHAMAAAIFNNPTINSTSSDSKQIVSGALGTTASPTIAPVPATAPIPMADGVARFKQIFNAKPPSYMDARNFSSAFWHVVTTQNPDDLIAAAKSVAPAGVPAAATGAEAMAQLAAYAPGQLMRTLSTTVQKMPAGSMRDQLLALLMQAGNDYNGVLAATDGWFNAQMDRVSGWYKRETQWIMAAIALVVVTLTGVDSVEMVKLLSASTPQALEQIAQSVTPDSVKQQANVLTGQGGAVTAGSLDVTKFVHMVTPRQNFFENWIAGTKTPSEYHRWPGLVVTYLALVLGGPFWFDALKSLANIRSAGRKPQRNDQPPK